MQQLNSRVHPELRIGASPSDAIEHVSDFDLSAIEPKLVRPPFVLQLADRLPSKPRMSASTFIPEPTPILHHLNPSPKPSLRSNRSNPTKRRVPLHSPLSLMGFTNWFDFIYKIAK
jgi:hypothetical protein